MTTVRGRRRGAGMVVVLALSVVLVLAVVFFAQSRLTSSVTADAAALVHGDVLQALVDSALQEAQTSAARQADDPASPLFEAFRKLVYYPDTGAFTVTDAVDLPETRALLADPYYKDYVVETPEVQVVLQRQLDKTEYERFGLLRYRVRGHFGSVFGRKVVRTVEVAQAFKVALTTVPRPYDSYGLYVAEAEGLTDRDAVNERRAALFALNEQLRSVVRQARAHDDGGAAGLALEGRMVPVEGQAERTPELPSLEGCALLGLPRVGVKLDLVSLDLAAYLDVVVVRAKQAIEEAAAASGRVDETFIEAADRANMALYEGLFRIWSYQEAFWFVPAGHEARKSLDHYAFSFQKDFWQRRVQYCVKPREGEPDCQAAWQRFLAFHPRVNGVVAIENTTPIRLTGLVPGRSVIVVGPGGAVIDGLNQEAGAGDLVTVVAYAGPVTVASSSRCSVFLCKPDGPAAPELAVAPGADVLGSLAMWDASQARILQGRLVRDMRYGSGYNGEDGRVVVNPHLLHVAVSPTTSYRKAGRS